MLRRDGKESCDDTAVLAAATMAEALRPTFSQGTVTLRQFVNWSAISMLGISMKLGESVVSEGQLSSKLGLASKNSPFLTKQNMSLIRGLVMAGFTLKRKGADNAASGGEASH